MAAAPTISPWLAGCWPHKNHDPRPDVGADKTADEQETTKLFCPSCGGRMIIIEIFEPGAEPAAHHQRAAT